VKDNDEPKGLNHTRRRSTSQEARRHNSGSSPNTLTADRERSKKNQPESETEKKYRLLAENVADIICALDLDLCVTYLSPSVTHLLGYTVEEALGQQWERHIDEYLTLHSSEIAIRTFREIVACANQGQQDMFKSWTFELEFFRKDGSTLWTECNACVLRSPDGEPVGYLGIVRDIAERRRAQELFKTLANNSPIAVYIVQDGKFQFVNVQFQQHAGVNESELLGMDASEFVLPEDRDMVRRMSLAMLKGERSNPYEFRFVSHDGQIKWVIERVASIQHNGRPATLANFMDIMERKHSEEVLMRSESQLRLLSQRIIEVQEEEQARIARELHDQLGQELVALKIEAVSLAEKLADAPVLRERARAILDLAERLDATSHRIAVSIRPEILDELGLVKAIQWYAEDFERRSGISCPVEAPVDEPMLPKQTATSAYRIVQEALTNVWKHSRASQAKIKVTARDTLLSVSVSDNGAGMDLKRLSDMPSLGLLGMRERARLVGGRLSIKRNHGGRGTCVAAHLPISPSHSDTGVNFADQG
jgi:two-component system sensor histidine kinase UhpB